jgi:ABC-type uncharacterized transport system auxiliary subunit
VKVLAGVVVCVLLCACGAVDVPTARTYRLMVAGGQGPARTGTYVLRVQDLRLAAHVSPEHVMVADGPTLLQAHPLDQWAGPLDRMLTDVVTLALRRSGGFADVKAGSDIGREDLWLSATVTEFHYARDAHADTARAVVAFAAQVRRAADHALLWSGELRAEAPASCAQPAAAVQALGVAVQSVVTQLVAACGALPAEGAARGAGPRDLATPPGR